MNKEFWSDNLEGRDHAGHLGNMIPTVKGVGRTDCTAQKWLRKCPHADVRGLGKE
jgi:hypothetical protein